MNSYKSIIKADYLQRTRSYSFLITLLASVCLAYTFLPTAEAGYSTVRVGDYSGEYNSAWVGHVTAIMASTFLWLIGFYLVNNGIKRDKETGVGQIIAATAISNFKYLLAKALSNFFVLLTITCIIMLMAVSLVLIRGIDSPFNVFQFLSPYLFSTIPSIFFVSVLAVFAEVAAGRYTILQNIAFFFLFGIMASNIQASSTSSLNWLDVLGTKQITDDMADMVNTTYSNTKNAVSVGFMFGSKDSKKYFLFEGTNWSAVYLLSRLSWMAVAFFLLYISSKLFHRFDVKEKIVIKKKNTVNIIEKKAPPKEIHLSALPVAAPVFGILPFVKTELLMLVRKGPKWFWFINLGGFIALFFIPLATAHQFGLPVLWFLQVNRWADIATKEKYYRTHYFTYAAYKPLQRLLTAQVIAGILLAIAFASPIIIRFILSGDFLTVTSILLGAILLVAFSVCTGMLTSGKRFFEIVFFMLTYSNVNRIPVVDYFGALNQGMAYITILLCFIFVLLSTAFLFRGYEIRNQ